MSRWSTSLGRSTTLMRPGASPSVPITSSWSAWPISTMWWPSSRWRRASWCTLATSGQVASITNRSRSSASSAHVGRRRRGRPARRWTPAGTSSTSCTKTAPSAFEAAHDVGVVDDLAAHVDGRAVALEGPLDDGDGPLDAGAERARPGGQHAARALTAAAHRSSTGPIVRSTRAAWTPAGHRRRRQRGGGWRCRPRRARRPGGADPCRVARARSRNHADSMSTTRAPPAASADRASPRTSRGDDTSGPVTASSAGPPEGGGQHGGARAGRAVATNRRWPAPRWPPAPAPARSVGSRPPPNPAMATRRRRPAPTRRRRRRGGGPCPCARRRVSARRPVAHERRPRRAAVRRRSGARATPHVAAERHAPGRPAGTGGS